MEQCLNILCADIDEWNGINKTKTNRGYKEFKIYFKLSKNWWCQHKKIRYGQIYCFIFKYVEDLCNKSQCKQNCIYPFMLALLNKTVKFRRFVCNTYIFYQFVNWILCILCIC